MSDLNLVTFCQQKRNRINLSIVNRSNRFELVSPYSTYTKYDLDMRRKAEILKYSGKYESTKSNGTLTKAQKFTQLVNGKGSQQKLVDPVTRTFRVSEERIFCDSSLNRVYSGASGVPGPSVPLYLDDKVPLYNYITKRTYNENDPTNDPNINSS